MPSPSSSTATDETERDPHSSFSLSITLSVGYQRKRAVIGTKWEGTIISVLLAVGGVTVVVLFLFLIARWTSLL